VPTFWENIINGGDPMTWLLYGVGILCFSGVLHVLLKRFFFQLLKRVLAQSIPHVIDRLNDFKVIKALTQMAPFIVTYVVIRYYPPRGIGESTLQLLGSIINIGLIIMVLKFIYSVVALILHQLGGRYPNAKTLTRSVAQVIKIIACVTGAIIVFSILLNKSPVVILSSLGALTAVFLLVFKDTILGFVASIQVTLLGNVKVGDWIEMPKFNANGTVLDINISSIRVQNWDKTITTIPTYALVSEPVKNWRGMTEARARRIRRSLWIDLTSIRFLTADELDAMKQVNHLQDYLTPALADIDQFNSAQLNNAHALNTRKLTNLGLFRQYLYAYLRDHPAINQSTTLLVRQQQSSPTGVPLQIYCFTNTTCWVAYEDIQSDIFDYILASVPLFGLRVFQYSKYESGALTN
jgi:miniconductance mechanosensitive channel